MQSSPQNLPAFVLMRVDVLGRDIDRPPPVGEVDPALARRAAGMEREFEPDELAARLLRGRPHNEGFVLLDVSVSCLHRSPDLGVPSPNGDK